jgi:hypothetical protein
MYFGLQGVGLPAGGVAEATIQVPNPLGGGEIPARFRVHMESVTPGSASLTTTTSYDAAALQRMVQSLGQPGGLAKLAPVHVNDQGTYLFDRTIGMMRDVIVNRHISAGSSSRYDRWQLRLINGPRR